VTRQLPLLLQHFVELDSAAREAAVYSLIFHLNSQSATQRLLDFF
jgi:hypothetical protein